MPFDCWHGRTADGLARRELPHGAVKFDREGKVWRRYWSVDLIWLIRLLGNLLDKVSMEGDPASRNRDCHDYILVWSVSRPLKYTVAAKLTHYSFLDIPINCGFSPGLYDVTVFFLLFFFVFLHVSLTSGKMVFILPFWFRGKTIRTDANFQFSQQQSNDLTAVWIKIRCCLLCEWMMGYYF